MAWYSSQIYLFVTRNVLNLPCSQIIESCTDLHQFYRTKLTFFCAFSESEITANPDQGQHFHLLSDIE